METILRLAWCEGGGTMKARSIRLVLTVMASLTCTAAWPQANRPNPSPWQQEFDIASCTLTNVGRNRYFVLEPGFQIILEGGNSKLQITVLDEVKVVSGVTTRVVEEREWKRGELYEVSRNYFALCDRTKDVFYFGEEVDFYESGQISKHDGSWLAGMGGNRAGLMMAGSPRPGMRYYQEVAPNVAMDRAEIVSMNETCRTPAGTFPNCMKVKEESPLEPGVTEYKYFAPGVGLVREGELQLTRYGVIGAQ
jgi:hypothetical protein